VAFGPRKPAIDRRLESDRSPPNAYFPRPGTSRPRSPARSPRRVRRGASPTSCCTRSVIGDRALSAKPTDKTIVVRTAKVASVISMVGMASSSDVDPDEPADHHVPHKEAERGVAEQVPAGRGVEHHGEIARVEQHHPGAHQDWQGGEDATGHPPLR